MAAWHFQSRRRGPASTTGKLGTSVFFFFFLAMGLAFSGLLLYGTWQNLETRFWTPTPCTIIDSAAQEGEGDDGYQFVVSYRYAYESRDYTSERYQRSTRSFDHYAAAERLTEAYAPGTQTTCLVNPDNPSEAVLTHGDLWMIFFIVIPLVFVVIGAGGIYFTWKRGQQPKPAGEADGATVGSAISSPAGKKSTGRKFLAVFFAIFLVAGIAASWLAFIRPALKVQVARDWPAVPCVVESSRVRSHDSDDGTTYSVDILYRYEAGGKVRRSNRYAFLGGSSSGYEGKREIVDTHPPDHETVCYVNPDDPSEAVLNREMTTGMWLLSFTLLFPLIGAGGLLGMASGKFKGRQPSPTGFSPSASPTRAAGGAGGAGGRSAPLINHGESTGEPVTLKCESTPGKKAVGALFFALIWNGIVSIFVVQVIRGFIDGDPEWFLTFFMIPFVAVGLGAIGMFVYFLLAMRNPKATLVVNADRLPLGSVLDVAWDLVGRTDKLTRLRIHLEGEEKAEYRQGTNTYTDTQVFREIDLIDTTDGVEMVSGAASVTIPRDTMHSFEAEHNKIIWHLRVRGEIPLWPDVHQAYVIEVLPEATSHE